MGRVKSDYSHLSSLTASTQNDFTYLKVTEKSAIQELST